MSDISPVTAGPTEAELDSVRTMVSSAPLGVADEIRRLHLRYPALSKADIAKKVGCSWVNVHNVLKRFMGDDCTEDDLRDYQENKADIFDALQRRIMSSITNEDIAKAPLMARVTAGAILEDKARVIRGQATGVNVTVLMDAIDAIRSKPANPPQIEGKL